MYVYNLKNTGSHGVWLEHWVSFSSRQYDGWSLGLTSLIATGMLRCCAPIAPSGQWPLATERMEAENTLPLRMGSGPGRSSLPLRMGADAYSLLLLRTNGMDGVDATENELE